MNNNRQGFLSTLRKFLSSASTGSNPFETYEPSIFGPLMLAAAFWLTIAGGEPRGIIAVLFVVWVVGGIGARILSVGGIAARGSGVHLLRFGPGVVTGLFILFLLRLFTSFSVFVALLSAYSLFEVAIAFRSARRRLRQKQFRELTAEVTRKTVQMTCWIAAVIGLGVVRSWPWTLPVIAGLLLSGGLLQFSTTSLLRNAIAFIALLTAMSGLVWLAIFLRPDLWWMHADDNQFFDALSHSLIHNGPTVNVIATARDGLSAAAYHHLAFFLTGLLDLLVWGETYETLTRYTPVLLALVAVTSSLTFLRFALSSNDDRDLCSSLTAVAYLLVLIPISAAVYSNHLGFSAVVSSAAVAVFAARQVEKWPSAIVIALMIPITAFSKATSTYATFLVILAVSLLMSPRRIRTAFASVLMMLGVFWFLSTSPSSSDFRLEPFSENSISEFAFGSVAWRLIAILVVLAPLAPGLVLGVWLWSKRTSPPSRALLHGLAATLTVGFVSRFLIGGRIETIRYNWEPAVFASSLVVALAIMAAWHQPDWRRRHPAIAVFTATIFVSALGLSQLLPNLDSGSDIAKLLRILRRPDFVLMSGIFIVLVAMVVGRYRGNPQSSTRHWSIRVLICLIPIVAAVNQVPGFIESYSEARSGKTDSQRRQYLASQEVIEVGNYLRETTESDSLVAVTICDYEAGGCSTDYSLAAYSQRRFHSLGGSFVLYWNRDDLVSADATGSVVTASNPLPRVISYWRSRGVDYGVIDFDVIPEPDRALLEGESMNVIFENNRFAVLDLRDSRL